MKLSKKTMNMIITASVALVLGLGALIAGIIINSNILYKLSLEIDHGITNLDTILMVAGGVVAALGVILLVYAIITKTTVEIGSDDISYIESLHTKARSLFIIGVPVFVLGCIALSVFGVMSFNPQYTSSLIETLRNLSAIDFVVGSAMLITVIMLDQKERSNK